MAFSPVYLARREAYQKYQQTDHWKNLRASYWRYAIATGRERRKWWGWTCEICWNWGRLELGHRTYAHLGNEDLTELMLQCRDCNQEIWAIGMMYGIGVEKATEIVRSYRQRR